MALRLPNGERFCVLIPSRQRVAVLEKTLRKMPWLNNPDTFIGFEHLEYDAYEAMLTRVAPRVMRIKYDNDLGSVALAREALRVEAIHYRYAHYVVTDDNAIHQSESALYNLVRCAAEWPTKPVIMAGMHNTAPHFDRGKIARKKTVLGLTSYPTVAMMFQVYSHGLYSMYRYPERAFGLDDRHLALWALEHGVTDFRVCMDAPFTKSRYGKKDGVVQGGQGTIEERMIKCGWAIEQLAHDFPKYVGAVGTLRIPWQFLMSMVDGHTADRLVGGAMRSTDAIVRRPVRVKIRKRL
jgi:hypothetical protein